MIPCRTDVLLAPHTSLRVGGPARFFVEARSAGDVTEAATLARAQALPLRVLGSGTNILVPDSGVDAVVLACASRTYECVPEDENVLLLSDAGVAWDALVRAASERGLWGIENLAGIPGSTGGALVQNIGAYGAECSRVFAFADVYDLSVGTTRRVFPEEAALAYRSSVFKRDRNLIIMRVALRLSRAGEPDLRYADLARAYEAGAVLTTPGDVADAVRAIRARKFPAGVEGGTAGSFFKNPLLSEADATLLSARFPELPRHPEADGRMKVSLAWLFDHALGLKGFARGPVRLFERQPLVLVALPGARALEIDEFARGIEARVRDELGITIEREVETFSGTLS